MNNHIRVEKIIGTVKCVATCSAIEIQAVETWNSSAAVKLFANRHLRLFARHYH